MFLGRISSRKRVKSANDDEQSINNSDDFLSYFHRTMDVELNNGQILDEDESRVQTKRQRSTSLTQKSTSSNIKVIEQSVTQQQVYITNQKDESCVFVANHFDAETTSQFFV